MKKNPELCLVSSAEKLTFCFCYFPYNFRRFVSLSSSLVLVCRTKVQICISTTPSPVLRHGSSSFGTTQWIYRILEMEGYSAGNRYSFFGCSYRITAVGAVVMVCLPRRVLLYVAGKSPVCRALHHSQLAVTILSISFSTNSQERKSPVIAVPLIFFLSLSLVFVECVSWKRRGDLIYDCGISHVEKFGSQEGEGINYDTKSF